MSTISFDDQVVIVTGAGAGLGRTHALEFARRGASVLVNDPGFDVHGGGGSAGVAEAVVAEIAAEGGSAIASFEAVGTPESGERIAAQAVDAFGRIDAVVLNAGVQGPARFEDATLEDYERIMSTHLGGSFWTAQAAYRRMLEQGYGRLVFTSSSAGVFGNVERAAYGAAKGGIFALSNTIALEGREHGIKSNALMPLAHTRMVGVRKTKIPELTHAMDALRARLTPEYVTPLVVYLASDACHPTGSLFSAGAGRYARAVVGVPRGWAAGSKPPSVDEIAAHWDEIDAREEIEEPQSTVEELLLLSRQLLP